MTSTYRFAPFLAPLTVFRPVPGPIKSSMLLALLVAVLGRGIDASPGVEVGPMGGVFAVLDGPVAPACGNMPLVTPGPGPSAGVPVLLGGAEGGPMPKLGVVGFDVGGVAPMGGRGGPPKLIGGAGVPPILGGGGVAVFVAASGLSGLTHLPKSLS